MKVLLKKEVCELREQCTRSTRTQLTLLPKKKKVKRRHASPNVYRNGNSPIKKKMYGLKKNVS